MYDFKMYFLCFINFNAKYIQIYIYIHLNIINCKIFFADLFQSLEFPNKALFTEAFFSLKLFALVPLDTVKVDSRGFSCMEYN